jgi:hypothetical protein
VDTTHVQVPEEGNRIREHDAKKTKPSAPHFGTMLERTRSLGMDARVLKCPGTRARVRYCGSCIACVDIENVKQEILERTILTSFH